jgi:hypothetical protein
MENVTAIQFGYEEDRMEPKWMQAYNFENIAWAALFIWWGGILLFPSLPDGLGMIGTGLIFLGVNFTRRMIGIPTRSLTTILGILALTWGGSELINSVSQLPFKIPTFAMVLIILGIILLARELKITAMN